MKIKTFTFIATLFFSLQAYGNSCVILLHGLARTDNSLKKMELALQGQGYNTVNYRYPSTKQTIEVLAENTIIDALRQCPHESTINFVTHSLGGILVRQYLSQKNIKQLGRVVMLGPPNQGSQVVDKLKSFPGFKLANGPAGLQLGTGEMSIPNKLGAANFDLGIIAGTRSINPILSTMLPNPDDGKVSVENTKLKGMKDHIALPVTHTLMMNNKEVISQTAYYLKNGIFEK